MKNESEAIEAAIRMLKSEFSVANSYFVWVKGPGRP
jgi:hypothetical protein